MYSNGDLEHQMMGMLLICSLLHCGPSNNFCYLGHTKNPDDDYDDDEVVVCYV